MTQPTLVLIHGYPFDHTLWDQVIALMEPGVQVLAPDLRGFGGQPAGSEAPSLDVMADDIDALLAKQDIGRAVIAGMSMGGYVALSFAQHHPERLAGLALVSSQPQADTDEARTGRRNLIDKIRREGPQAASATILSKIFAPANSNKPELIRFPTAGAEKAGVDGLAWALEAMARRPDRTSVLQGLRVPVLVIHGAEDQLIPAERARAVGQMASHSRYVEVPQAGHATPIEAPGALADALQDLIYRSYANRPG